LNGQIVRKQYQFSTGEDNDSRIEKNIGVNYTYKFWNPCILGIGHCETVRPPRAMLQPNDPNAVDSTSTKNNEIKPNGTKPTEKAK
jgi:hypothetical protein